MAKDRNVDFKVPENPSRAERKKERGRGRLAMGKVEQAEWTKRHDPLHGVKGIERHLRMKQMR